jgi:hypothetical protein
MSFGRQKQQSGLDPQIREAFLGNLGRAQDVAANLGARQFAGFTPDQESAFGLIRQFAAPDSIGMQRVGQGADAVRGASLYQPQMVSGQQVSAQGFGGATIDPAAQARAEQAARSGVRDVSSATGAAGMQAYFNPFEDQVVQGALGDIERSRQMQQMQGAAQAQRAGAFGGSRQGVAQALTNEAALREAGRTAAGLRSEGFQFAAGMGQQDSARALQAQMANQGVDMSLEQANAQLRQQVGLSNQDAINRRAMEQAGLTQQAGLFSATAQNQAAQREAELAQQALLANQQAGLAGAGLNLQAGTQLANIGEMTQNLGFTQAAQLGQIGQQQQALSQAQLDAIRNLPLEQQQIINASLGINPGGGSGGVSSGSGFNFSLMS